MPSEIEVSCPGCNAVFSVPVELSGEAAECSECAAIFEIPRLEERPDAIDTDTGVIKGVAPATDYTSTATNTVKLSRSSIGMIPTLKDSFTFGNKAPGVGLGIQPPPSSPPPPPPQPSAWGAPQQQQPRMAPPPARPAPAAPAPVQQQMAPRPPMAPQQAAPARPVPAPAAPAPVQQQVAPRPPMAPQQAAPQMAPQQPRAPQPAAPARPVSAPAPVQQQPAPQPAPGVASMLGGAPAQAPAAQKPTFAKPPAPPQPPPARPVAPAPAAPAPAHSTAPILPHPVAPAPAPTTSTQGVPAQHANVKLPAWTSVQLKQGEEAVAYKEDSKNPAVPAVLASIPVVLCAGAVFLGTMGLIVVGVLCVATFIVAFVMSKGAAKRAVILTTQRAICIIGKDRIELKK